MTTTTMTQKPVKNNNPVKPEFNAQQAIQDTAKFLKENCYAVELEVGWFSTSKKLDAKRMADVFQDGEDLSMYSVNFKLFDASEPHIKRLNDAKAALVSYRDSSTIPMAKLPLDEAVQKELEQLAADDKLSEVQATNATRRLLAKEAGVRVIMASDIDTFDNYVTNVLIPNLRQAAEDATAHRDEIVAHSKAKLGKDFDERNYPEKFVVSVRGPIYREIGVGIEFEKQCPAAAERIAQAAQRQFEDTVQLAVGDFANSFMETVSIAARQLSNRTKLMPLSAHPRAKQLREAEVLEVETPKDDETIPEGHVKILVAYRENKRRVEEWLGPVSKKEYETLNPVTSTERCKVYGSTFEKLLDDLQRFQKIRDMLGDLGGPLAGLVEKVRELLQNAGGDAAEIAEQVKRSTYFRNQGAKLFAEVADAVEQVVDTMPVKKKSRRRSIGKL